MLFEDFHEWSQSADAEIARVWHQNSGAMGYDPIQPDLGLGHVMAPGLNDLDDETDDEERHIWEASRVRCLKALLDFLWADGPHPVRALKRLFAVTRRMSPQHLGFMTLQSVATLLNETRQATQTREELLWEKFLQGKGFFGTGTHGSKSPAARKRYSKDRQGRQDRRGGKRAIKKFTALREQAKAKQPKKSKAA